MFLPTTQTEIADCGWDRPDIILVSGDTYIDSPYIGLAVIGRVLTAAGFRVAVIAQPATGSPVDITRLGEPKLFWGVSGGSVDSLVANYTATRKFRKQDDYTPGGINNRRPDRAVIVYSNLIRQYFKGTAPIVLGGIEASLRRVAHYDFWSNRIRRSILFDAKADYLVYGMADNSIVDLARTLAAGQSPDAVRGLCRAAREPPPNYLVLPSYRQVLGDKSAFIKMFHAFYRNNDPKTATGLCQQQDTRYLVQNPPAPYLTQAELDQVFALDFERAVHPYYARDGEVRALDTIRSGITTHRGCYGECNFCAIAVHQGRTVRSRSPESIIAEAAALTQDPEFKGVIRDVGGPTANMYGFECARKLTSGACADKRCLFPEICPSLKPDHRAQIDLLRRLRALPGVSNVFVASGLRYDLVLGDPGCGRAYLRDLVEHHISGQLKVAPEHTQKEVLRHMGKPGVDPLKAFKQVFEAENRRTGKQQFLTYYLIAAHPGCTMADMAALKAFAGRELRVRPEQVQVFTPTPSTYSTLMYYTQTDPFTGKPVFVETELGRKEKQKRVILDDRRQRR